MADDNKKFRLTEAGLAHFSNTQSPEEQKQTHKNLMKTDSDYRWQQQINAEKAKRVKAEAKASELKGTQPGHSVTDAKNFSRPVGGESGIGLGGGLPEQMK